MPRLFEQVENNNPSVSQRLGFGRSGNITENMTFANFLTWLNANLTYPVVPPTVVTTKIIEIGDWDMDATATPAGIAHGLTFNDIRSVSVLIRNDLNTFKNPLLDQANNGNMVLISGSNIVLTRETGGWFDNTNYDSTSFNRGWIIIEHV